MNDMHTKQMQDMQAKQMHSSPPRAETMESIQAQASSNVEGTVAALMAADRILCQLKGILYGQGQNANADAKPSRLGASPLADGIKEQGYLISQVHERLTAIESLIHN